MKKGRIGSMIVEGLVTMATGLVLEAVITGIRNRKTKEDPDSRLVGELTVGEFKEIIEEGQEA